MATITTWNRFAATANYVDVGNWSGGLVPGPDDTAEFKASDTTNISIISDKTVGAWLFNPGAGQYNFNITYNGSISFEGGGIAVNAGSVHIFNFDITDFTNGSTAGGSLIDNFAYLDFAGSSTAGAATIHTFGGGGRSFFDGAATGGFAQFITDASGFVDFSGSVGRDGRGHVTAGSIAGAGAYRLGADQLTVGLNGLSTEVSGPVEDDGAHRGSGASLVKAGHGALKLSHTGNTYTGGTTLESGVLDLAAVRAAGPEAIAFAGRATLKIENSALSAHHFGNLIDFFAKHDLLDLTGLHFHAGATAIYHKVNHHLIVHSGGKTDTLTLLSPHGTHFEATSDHHGGTDMFLVFA